MRNKNRTMLVCAALACLCATGLVAKFFDGVAQNRSVANRNLFGAQVAPADEVPGATESGPARHDKAIEAPPQKDAPSDGEPAPAESAKDVLATARGKVQKAAGNRRLVFSFTPDSGKWRISLWADEDHPTHK